MPNAAWHLYESSDGAIWVAGSDKATGKKVLKITAKEKEIDLHQGAFMFAAFKDADLYKELNFAQSEDRWLGPSSMTFDPKNGSIWLRYIYEVLKGDGHKSYPILANHNKHTGETQFYHLKELNLRSLTDAVYKGNSSIGWFAAGMAVAKDGKVWGSYPSDSVGVFCFDPTTGSTINYRHIPDDSTSLMSNYVVAVFMDSRGDVWAGQYEKGLSQLNPSTGIWTHYPLGPKEFASGAYTPASIIEGEDGQIWFGGTNSMLQPFIKAIDPITKTIRDLTLSQQLHGGARVLAQKKEKIYFESPEYGLGVLSFDRPNDPLFFYSSSETNLPIHDIATAVFDNEGNLWITSRANATIVKLDPERQQWISLKSKGGKQPLSRNGVLGPDGNIFFPTFNAGWLEIDPDEIKLPPVESLQLRLVDLLASGERQIAGKSKILPKPIWELNRLNLSSQTRNFGFRFSSFNFHSHKVIYHYRLYPHESEWIVLDGDPVVNYNYIPPGTYTFQVKAFNVDGQSSGEGINLEVVIHPPWWKTNWAFASYVLIILGLFFLQRRRLMKKQEEKLEKERQINEQLRRLDTLKDQFLANTSHELRTPLQGIIGLSESMIDQVQAPDHRENLRMIISSGKRLNNLVNDILDFSKLKNYDIELLQKPVDVRSLVEVVLNNNVPLTKGKQLKLVNDIPSDLPAVFADENRLQQIFYNLIGNAIKFTEVGEVKVSASPKEDMIELSVQDTGIGIPEDKRDAIFQEFEQGDGSISRKFAGTGLGLSISKRMVELHGGQMWVKSTYAEASVDKSEVMTGSTFFFTLPVSKGKTTTLSQVGETHQIPSTTSYVISNPATKAKEGNIRILVVDDEPINQQVLKNHLHDRGFHLTQAMNGEEAIQTIQGSEPFDLVLLDVMMPRMSGYEVCQKIREKYLASELPVIMVTAKNQLQDVVQGLSMGANDYLPKPFHKEELLARINTQLDLHRMFNVAGRFVPNEFLHSLNKERITEVMLGDHTEKEVTVLFTDIRDYTAVAENMTPEENFNFVNAFHRRMGPVIQKHGGFVNQYLGDGLMAIFSKSVDDAVKAAIEMQKTLQEYNIKRVGQNRQALKMGIGLHTGPLIMGIIGDQHRMDATTIADTVNTASRIESLTKHYGVSVLLTEDSLKQLENRNSFRLRHLGIVQVKGKKDPVGIYECFDGDSPEIAEQKQETIRDFEKGLEHFFSREFPEAAGAFNKVLKANALDYTARLFLNKSSTYTVEGVPDDWTGVEVMTFK